MDDSIRTLAKSVKVESKVKGSRFIAEALPIESVEEAEQSLKTIRKREHAASHHCYAYQIGLGNNTKFRYADDGEPSGTAGKPIYDCVTGRGLTNVLTVVTRYFGGTMLGTGGLARAYGKAAGLALDKAGVKTVYITDRLSMQFDLKFYDKILQLLNKYDAREITSGFSDVSRLSVAIRKSKTKIFLEEVTNLTHGQIKISY